MHPQLTIIIPIDLERRPKDILKKLSVLVENVEYMKYQFNIAARDSKYTNKIKKIIENKKNIRLFITKNKKNGWN